MTKGSVMPRYNTAPTSRQHAGVSFSPTLATRVYTFGSGVLLVHTEIKPAIILDSLPDDCDVHGRYEAFDCPGETI